MDTHEKTNEPSTSENESSGDSASGVISIPALLASMGSSAPTPAGSSPIAEAAFGAAEAMPPVRVDAPVRDDDDEPLRTGSPAGIWIACATIVSLGIAGGGYAVSRVIHATPDESEIVAMAAITPMTSAITAPRTTAAGTALTAGVTGAASAEAASAAIGSPSGAPTSGAPTSATPTSATSTGAATPSEAPTGPFLTTAEATTASVASLGPFARVTSSSRPARARGSNPAEAPTPDPSVGDDVPEAVAAAPTEPAAEPARPHSVSSTAGLSLEELLERAAPTHHSHARDEGEAEAPRVPAHPERVDVLHAMHDVTPAAERCGGQHGTATVHVTVSHTGRVTSALVTGTLAGTEAGSCVARAVRNARFERFTQDSFSFDYPFRI